LDIVGRSLAIILWELQNNKSKEIKYERWNNRMKKHSQDVYQIMNYCIVNVYVVFVKGYIFQF
jgi:hypothetical protein